MCVCVCVCVAFVCARVFLLCSQDMLEAEMHTPLLCAKHASAAMKGVGGSMVFVSNVGERTLSEQSGNVGAIAALTSSAAAAGGPAGIRVNCVTHTLGDDEDGEGITSSRGHGTFSLATMRGPSSEDVAMQVSTDRRTFCEEGIVRICRFAAILPFLQLFVAWYLSLTTCRMKCTEY